MKTIKKALSLFLAIAITIAIVPSTAFASTADVLYDILLEPAIGSYFNSSTYGDIAIVREKVYYVPSSGKTFAEMPSGDDWIWEPARLASYTGGKTKYISDYYSDIGSFSDNGYAVARLNNKYGVIDSTGKLTIPFDKYDHIYQMSDDGYVVARIQENEYKYILINVATGSETEITDTDAWYFSSELAVSTKFEETVQHSVYIYETPSGVDAFNRGYDYASDFSHGYAAVQTVGSDVYEIIDKNGTQVLTVPSGYYPENIGDDGSIVVINNSGKFGYIDLLGNWITNCVYDWAEPFKNGYAVVYGNAGCGIIGSNGKVIIPLGKYDKLTDVSSTGLVWAGAEYSDTTALLRVKPGANLEPGIAEIVSLTPANGSVIDEFNKIPGYQTFADIKITFDRELSTVGDSKYADLNFSAGNIKVIRDSTGDVVFEAKPKSNTSELYDDPNKECSNDLIVQNQTTLYIRVDVNKFRQNESYSIIVDKGFVNFKDGSVNAGITDGEWKFTIKASSNKDGISFNYTTTLHDDATYSGISYDDRWFFGDSYEYNHQLAIASLALAMSGFGSKASISKDKNVKKLLSDLGFESAEYYSSGYYDEDHDTVAYAVSNKTIESENGETATLVAICLRGGEYGGGGWEGNLNVGDSGAYHEGFYKASVYMRKEIQRYFETHNIDKENVRIWLTGYSRSAAVANLLAAGLSIDNLCKKDNIFTYTFATPNNQIIVFETPYRNIFNIVNPIDIVPFVPLSSWNFGKMGTTLMLPQTVQGHVRTKYYTTVSSKFNEITGGKDAYYMPGDVASVHNWLQYAVSKAVLTRNRYYSYLETPIIKFIQGDSAPLDSLLLGITTAEELNELAESKEIITIISKLNAVLKAHRNDPASPIFPLLDQIIKVLKGYLAENINSENGRTNHEIVSAVGDLFKGGFSSGLLRQHWPETYLAWMTSINSDDLTKSMQFVSKTVIIQCPVDVSVYDENDKLVAQIINNKVQDISDSTVTAAVIGESDKMFIMPNDHEYRISITATDEGTMDYTIMENAADGSVIRTVEFYDIDLAVSDVFTGEIDNIEETNSKNYILSKNGESQIYPDYDSLPNESEPEETPNPVYPVVPAPKPSYQIQTSDTIDGGTVSVTPSRATSGDTVTLTPVPDPGYTLDTLTVTTPTGANVELTPASDGTYSFKMPGSSVTISASFRKLPTPFTDVPSGAWYADSVWYTYYRNLFTGKTETQFAPDDTATRAEIVTVLWRMADKMQANLLLMYNDVPEETWYTEAVRWATAAVVVTGYNDKTFAPNDPVSREQFATMLYRYAQYENMDVSVTGDPLAKFPDAGNVAGWAKDSMAWAVDRGIITGAEGKLEPQGCAVRAQLAAMIERFAKLDK